MKDLYEQNFHIKGGYMTSLEMLDGLLYFICVWKRIIKSLDIYTIISILPAILMLIGIVELISERIVKLDFVLPKIRLFRGFGALTLGGICGVIFSIIELFIKTETFSLWMLVGAILCSVLHVFFLKNIINNRNNNL